MDQASSSRRGGKASISSLRSIPNVGPATEADLHLLGVNEPRDLAERDAFQMYKELCRITKARHDPCVIDVFMAAIDFVRTGESKPWWAFTPERKRIVAQRRNVT